MSKLRDRAREIREAGEESRSEYSPEAGSVPLRMYQYWARHRPSSVPHRENFCHYWRVVAIWAPLTWVIANFDAAVSKKSVQVGLAALYIGLIFFLLFVTDDSWGAALAMYIPIAVFAFLIGLFWVCDPEDEDTDAIVHHWAGRTLMVVGFPALLLGAAVGWIHNRWNKKLSRIFATVIIAILAAAVVAGVVGYIATDGWEAVLVIAGTIAVILVGGFVLILALNGIDAVIRWNRTRKKRKAQEDAAIAEAAVARGEKIEFIDDEPNIFQRFFSGFADLFLLVFQVIRTRKWKICPIVEIPDEKESLV